jgi:hypothetical protein
VRKPPRWILTAAAMAVGLTLSSCQTAKPPVQLAKQPITIDSLPEPLIDGRGLCYAYSDGRCQGARPAGPCLVDGGRCSGDAGMLIPVNQSASRQGR